MLPRFVQTTPRQICFKILPRAQIAEMTFRLKLLFGIRSEGSGAAVLQLTSRVCFSIIKGQQMLGWKHEVSLD